MPEWTLQQQQAISSPSRKIVCSAAAGSGKTAVMVERIVRMLREGADPESFLVVTFTNAAAAEMKQKIRDRLRQGRSEKNLRRAYEKIDMMEISTIHSFCQHLIREEFQAAGVDPFFAVCEPARAKKLFSDAFHDACAFLQEAADADYTRWKQCFSRKDTEEIVRTVHAFMMSLPDPFGWLDRACDDVPLHVDPGHPWFETASKIVRERIARAMVILRRQKTVLAVYLVSMALTITAGLILIPRLGLLGAWASFTVGQLVLAAGFAAVLCGCLKKMDVGAPAKADAE